MRAHVLILDGKNAIAIGRGVLQSIRNDGVIWGNLGVSAQGSAPLLESLWQRDGRQREERKNGGRLMEGRKEVKGRKEK